MAGRDASRGNPLGANVLAASGLLLPVKVFIFIKFILYVVVESVALAIQWKCRSCRKMLLDNLPDAYALRHRKCPALTNMGL